jgi:proline dehydrogenase
MLRALLLYLSDRESLKNLLSRYALGRRLAGRFIAGEELEDAVRTVRRLTGEGFAVTLDYLGESVHETPHAEQARDVYPSILDRLEAEGIQSHISVKLTQLGLDIDEALACRNLRAICERAARLRSFVRIDMESSAHTDATLRVFRAADAPREVLGIVIQAYLYRSEADIAGLLECGARIRLCKGAYMEPPEIAFPRKADVDANFVRLMERLLASGHEHAIATHDPKMVAATLEFARAHGISADRFEFQMLYGIGRRLQRDLLQKGYRVRIYVPYGKQWYSYFMRRLAERPANLVFLLKNLVRG